MPKTDTVGVRSGLLSMRWWLALVFAAIVASTAVFVAQLMTQRSEAAFRDRAEVLAAGATVSAANRLAQEPEGASLWRAADAISREEEMAIFVFDASGTLLTSPRSRGIKASSLPRGDLVMPPLQGERVIKSMNGGRRIGVALPLQDLGEASALVAIASRPDLVAAGRIVHGNLIGAVLLAIAAGALIGLAVAFAITHRLRHIAGAAVAIGAGDFDRRLKSRFPDELGQLAEAIDRMRSRLNESFESLEGERKRLARLLEQLQEGVVAVDSRLCVVYANNRARLLLSGAAVGEGDALPDPWSELSLPELASRLFERGTPVIYQRVSPSEEARTYAVAGVPARAGVALLVITDVSLQERRERAEREFVANAAHELRTPLSAIAGAAEALEAGAKDSPGDRDRFLAIINRQTARLSRLVRALLALARAQTGKEELDLEPVEMRPLLEEIGAEAREGGAIVELECPENLSVLAHPELLRQAIENLVANAIKHGPANDGRGNGTGEDSRGVVTIEAAPLEGGRVRIEVADRGDGLDPEERERAFDRFFRGGSRDGEGFGLGLSIVREVVTALDGEVTIDSEPGRGTRISILLPSAARIVRS